MHEQVILEFLSQKRNSFSTSCSATLRSHDEHPHLHSSHPAMKSSDDPDSLRPRRIPREIGECDIEFHDFPPSSCPPSVRLNHHHRPSSSWPQRLVCAAAHPIGLISAIRAHHGIFQALFVAVHLSPLNHLLWPPTAHHSAPRTPPSLLEEVPESQAQMLLTRSSVRSAAPELAGSNLSLPLIYHVCLFRVRQ